MMKWPRVTRGSATLRGRLSSSMAGDGFTGIYWFKSFKWFKKFKPFSSIRRIGRFELLERFERLEPFELLLPRLPDLQHPFLRFFLLGSHCGIGIGEAILFSR